MSRNLKYRGCLKPLSKAIALCFAFSAQSNQAATFNVTNNSDSGPDSLRDAINSANLNAGLDDITFDPGLGIITLTTGQIEIVESLTITGPAGGQTISGNDNSRIFALTSVDETLALDNLTLTNGVTTSDGDFPPDCSTALGQGGAVCAVGHLVMINSTITNSSTSGDNASGGGLFVLQNATLTNSAVTANQTTGYESYGGGLFVLETATLTNSTVSANQTRGYYSFGGGIAAQYLTLTGSTVTSNTTYGYYAGGGGIDAYSANLINSTVSNNQTENGYAYGGGLNVYTAITNDAIITANRTSGYASAGGGIHSYSTLTLSNSSVTNNSTTGDYADGGGIYDTGAEGGAPGLPNPSVIISTSTISGNNTDGIDSDGGGIDAFFLDITDSIISDNHTTKAGAEGGGIDTRYANVTNCIISLNTTSGDAAEGGGINIGESASFLNSTITGNRTTGDNAEGGGIDTGSATITNSTISGNSTAGDNAAGGGVNIFAGAVINNSTITGNQTTGPNSPSGGLYHVGYANETLTLHSTILAGNSINPAIDDNFAFDTTNSPTLDVNFSLFGDPVSEISGANTNNILNNTPGLSALADNGCLTPAGSTGSSSCVLTHAITLTSAALNTGSNPLTLTDDQRGTGFPRVINGQADIGAFEAGSIDAQCGIDHNQTLTATPVNLCTTGTAGTVTGSGPWGWTCDGLNGGNPASCSAQIQTYPITVTSNPVTGGNTNCAPNPVNHGSNSSCTATPNSGFIFDSWSGDCSGSSCDLNAVDSTRSVTANFATIIDGVCGADDSQVLTATPQDLCSSGTASAVMGNGPWTWACQGANTGNDASCSATIQTYPISANADPVSGGSVNCSPSPVNHGSDSSCTATANSGYVFNQWSGQCTGSSCLLSSVTSPVNVVAQFGLIADGACGADNGQILTSTPVNLCQTGTTSAVSGSGPWNWSCNGDNGGATTNCSANIQTYSITSSVNPPEGGSVSCTPDPVNHGATSSCVATANQDFLFSGWSGACSGNSCTLTGVVNPVNVVANFSRISDGLCGTDNGQTLTATPVNLCQTGTVSAVSGSGPWNWSCNGDNGGATTNCSANIQTYSITSTTNPPEGGTISCTPNPVNHDATSSCDATANQGFIFTGWSGACSGNICTLNGVMNPSAVIANFARITDGACGTDHGQSLTSTPTNLCSSGIASVVNGTGPWGWSCSGSNGGTTAQCNANPAIQPSRPVPALGSWSLLSLSVVLSLLGWRRSRNVKS